MIIFDLDGTLADCEHRRYLVDPQKNPNLEFVNGQWYYKNILTNSIPKRKKWKPDYQLFNQECNKDIPIHPVVEIFRNFKNDVQIWSGRCESVRQKTQEWLFYNGIGAFNTNTLKMRAIGDYTHDDILKEKWLDEAIAQGKTIEFVFDDRKKVTDMWRRRGIFVFDVNQSGKEF